MEGLGPPTWRQVGSKSFRRRWGSLLLNDLKLISLKNNVLEGSRLDFGGSRARFWSLQGWISTIFWHFLGRFLPSKSSKTCLLKSTMPKMPKRLKRLRGQPSSRRKRPECDHEGLFYHHGQGKKGWAAVVHPSGGLHQ